jgi:hypothetical protein
MVEIRHAIFAYLGHSITFVCLLFIPKTNILKTDSDPAVECVSMRYVDGVGR